MMGVRLPWVSREAANVTERRRVDAVEEAARLRAALDEERKRTWELMQEILAFKREGFVTHTAPVPVVREPDPIADAIADASKGDPALSRHFLTLANSMKRSGAIPADIIKVIAEYAE